MSALITPWTDSTPCIQSPRDATDHWSESAHQAQLAFQERNLASSNAYDEFLKAERVRREQQALVDARDAGRAYADHVPREGARLAYFRQLDQQLKSLGWRSSSVSWSKLSSSA